jgi:hypothetical protein
MTEVPTLTEEAIARCPKCGATQFSEKPLPSSAQRMAPGALRCTECQTIHGKEDLTGERFEFLRREYGRA